MRFVTLTINLKTDEFGFAYADTMEEAKQLTREWDTESPSRTFEIWDEDTGGLMAVWLESLGMSEAKATSVVGAIADALEIDITFDE